MSNSIGSDKALFDGLQSLVDTAFPKKCSNCGRLFQTVEDYISQTQGIRADSSGLKQSYDDDDSTIIELYRNCTCGSTLMDFFTDRRDLSDKGLRRREKFDELLTYLVEQGLDEKQGRQELLKVLRGQKSEVLSRFKAPKA